MALYTELYQLALADSVLRARATVAVVIAANTIRTEGTGVANHANRLVWAAAALANPYAWGERMLWAALAQNAGLTMAQIQGATDAALQTAIGNTIDLFATG